MSASHTLSRDLSHNLSRRLFLKATTGVAGLALLRWPGAFAAEATAATTEPDLEIRLTAAPDRVAILPGDTTAVWRYRGEVLRGDPSRVTAIPGSYLGPILRFRRGERVRIHFHNALPEPSIVHWHGLHVPAEVDGHPRSVIAAGEETTLEFTVANRAGTYWYHPHPHGRTGFQVVAGLAGLIVISDPEEQALGLPDGANDFPLVIQDRRFDADNQLSYLGSGGMGPMGGMMERMHGFTGDTILVNGHADYAQAVPAEAQRVRLLNGSNARIYRLAWQRADGTPGPAMTVIGSDGGLLDRPIERPFLTLGPAERVELWLDLSAEPLGSELSLVSLDFDNPIGGMPMMGMMAARFGGDHNGEPVHVCRLRVASKGRVRHTLPERLTPIAPLAPAANAQAPYRIRIGMAMGMGRMSWTLNGRSFAMDEVADDERMPLGSEMLWEFDNSGSGGMGMGMAMPHPMHVHGLQFQVVARDRSAVSRDIAAQLGTGQVDSGWKDTVLVLPGERVQVQMRFSDFRGRYLYHCHTLEHGDQGMMRNYEVV